jgi:cell shape-determining protein MreC
MEHLIRQLTEATRAMELATHEIHKRDARIHDLEIENQRLRDQLAFRMTQYDELTVLVEAVQRDNANFQARVRSNVERIRRMEEGEL